MKLSYALLIPEIQRVLRHALVPIMILLFSEFLGESQALELTEAVIVLVSYILVLSWSWINEKRKDRIQNDGPESDKEPGESNQ